MSIKEFEKLPIGTELPEWSKWRKITHRDIICIDGRETGWEVGTIEQYFNDFFTKNVRITPPFKVYYETTRTI